MGFFCRFAIEVKNLTVGRGSEVSQVLKGFKDLRQGLTPRSGESCCWGVVVLHVAFQASLESFRPHLHTTYTYLWKPFAGEEFRGGQLS